MSDRELPPQVTEIGGIWDDVQEALKWKPILPLLKKLENSRGTIDKAEAIRELAAFAIKTGLNTDPYNHRAFLIYAKFIDLMKKDHQWQLIIEGILK